MNKNKSKQIILRFTIILSIIFVSNGIFFHVNQIISSPPSSGSDYYSVKAAANLYLSTPDTINCTHEFITKNTNASPDGITFGKTGI